MSLLEDRAAGRAPTAADRSRRRSLIVYGLLVTAAVVPANLVARAGGANARDPGAASWPVQVALYGQALVPAAAALVAWAAVRQRPAWGWRRPAWRVLVSAWLIGMLAAGSGYLAAWLGGLAEFSWSRLGGATGLPPVLVLAVALGPGVLPWLLLAVGEELGWNSFLLPRLAERHGPDATAILLGAAWAAFHLPLMLLVRGAVAPGVPVGYAVAMFAIECVALTFPLVWLRLHSGSIWPALVLHATLNSVLYLAAEPATVPGAHQGALIGEGGTVTAAGTVLAVLATVPLWRRRAELHLPTTERNS